MLGLLERFPGYTLSSLMEEGTELIRMCAIRAMGTKERETGDG